MISYHTDRGKLTFAVAVVPRAGRSEVVGEHGDALKVRIAAPPVDGAANAELIRLLAKLFSVARQSVEIAAGEHGKRKLVSITGADATVLKQLIASKSNKS